MVLVFLFIAAVFAVWLLLLVSGWLSLRRTRRDPLRQPWRRLFLALSPILLGYTLFRYHLSFKINALGMNLSWPFAVPIALGTLALYFWIRAAWRAGNVA